SRRAKVPSTPSMTRARPSHTNIRAHSARTAAVNANSAQAAPQAVKTWTAKAARMRGAAGFACASVGSILSPYTWNGRSCAISLLLLIFRHTFQEANSPGQRMVFVDGVGKVRTADVAVVGGGPAGVMSAVALAAGGVDTLLIAPQPEDDHRTTALLAGSVTALATLGVWEACLPHAAALKTIRLIDDTQRLLRAPEVTFTAADIGLDAFGYNIENRHLIAALYARAAQLKITRICGAAVAIESDPAGATVKFEDGAARVRLVTGADGQRSLCRAAAGIGTDRRAYPQTALTLNLAHERPHQDTATEFH